MAAAASSALASSRDTPPGFSSSFDPHAVTRPSRTARPNGRSILRKVAIAEGAGRDKAPPTPVLIAQAEPTADLRPRPQRPGQRQPRRRHCLPCHEPHSPRHRQPTRHPPPVPSEQQQPKVPQRAVRLPAFPRCLRLPLRMHRRTCRRPTGPMRLRQRSRGLRTSSSNSLSGLHQGSTRASGAERNMEVFYKWPEGKANASFACGRLRERCTVTNDIT